MKVVVDFAKHITSLDQIKHFCERNDISKIIIDIINSPTDIGRNMINYKGETIATIKLEDIDDEGGN